MVAAVQGMAGWLRRNLAWSNSRQSWQERIAAAGLLAGALAILWYASELSVARQVLLWGILLVGLAALMRRESPRRTGSSRPSSSSVFIARVLLDASICLRGAK